MYLTRLHLNPARRGARPLLGSAHKMHAAVSAAFPPGVTTLISGPAGENSPSDSTGRILWRLDRPSRAEATLYLVSPAEPDLTHIVEEAGWPTTQTWQTRDYLPLLLKLDAGQTWNFRLKANPVHHVRVPGHDETKPLGHVTVKQQQDWLLKHSPRHGFEIPLIPDGPTGQRPLGLMIRERYTEKFLRKGKTVTLTTAVYDGQITITDPEALRRALTSGIGRAKGYGCGLMTLAPPEAH